MLFLLSTNQRMRRLPPLIDDSCHRGPIRTNHESYAIENLSFLDNIETSIHLMTILSIIPIYYLLLIPSTIVIALTLYGLSWIGFQLFIHN